MFYLILSYTLQARIADTLALAILFVRLALRRPSAGQGAITLVVNRLTYEARVADTRVLTVRFVRLATHCRGAHKGAVAVTFSRRTHQARVTNMHLLAISFARLATRRSIAAQGLLAFQFAGIAQQYSFNRSVIIIALIFRLILADTFYRCTLPTRLRSPLPTLASPLVIPVQAKKWSPSPLVDSHVGHALATRARTLSARVRHQVRRRMHAVRGQF